MSPLGVEWAKWSAYLMVRQKVEQNLATSNLPHVILRLASYRDQREQNLDHSSTSVPSFRKTGQSGW